MMRLFNIPFKGAGMFPNLAMLILCLGMFCFYGSAYAEGIEFYGARTYAAGTYPVSVFSVDLDGDGDSDLAVANYGSNNVSILNNVTIQLPIQPQPQQINRMP
ncbi:MAG: hypothetical protein A2Y53_01890 [Chloroflexi bacterium RBG_16_47_49]|nr:MAG: hypothetical protein A2Y53_01890 [Chloroflexi bacterium RBG_16_47_49]